MPVCRRVTTVAARAALAGIAALASMSACSSDSALDPGSAVPTSEIVTFDGSSTAVLRVGALRCNLDLTTSAVSGSQ